MYTLKYSFVINYNLTINHFLSSISLEKLVQTKLEFQKHEGQIRCEEAVSVGA